MVQQIIVDGCQSCRSISGEKRISPGPPIHRGRFWLVEHAYPSGLLGWVVIVLLRHAEAMHELTPEEAHELGGLQLAVARALHEKTGSQKEYSILFAEAEGFAHVHFHLVPRHHDLPKDHRGPGVFAFLKPEVEAIAPGVVAEWSEQMQALVTKYIGAN